MVRRGIRRRTYNPDDDWKRQPGESSEDYGDRMEDWNSLLENFCRRLFQRLFHK